MTNELYEFLKGKGLEFCYEGRNPYLVNSYIHFEYCEQFAKHQNKELIEFAKFIGDRPLPEYSKSTDKWRWWDIDSREYKYSTTTGLLAAWVKTNNK